MVQVAKSSDSKLFAFLAVLLSIIGFLIVFLAKRKDKYAMFYAKQSLVLFIAGLIVSAVGMVPLLGWIIAPILSLVLFVLWIIALVNTFSGQQKDTPLVGKYASKLDL